MIEPGQPYTHGWHIDVMCAHLEEVTDGNIRRLLINVPPGTMKSLLVNVFWPAWEWGPRNLPHLRYLATSHNMGNSARDNLKMRRLITSDWYKARWPEVKLTRDQNEKINFETTATGFRIAAAAGGITGKRGDRVLVDDPHSVDSANSDALRSATVEWFLEAIPSRLNNPDASAIIVVMQRLHEDDVSGAILDRPELGYVHLMLPMRYESDRSCVTPLGNVDPRVHEGELLFPKRYPEYSVRELEVSLASAASGQLQQRPSPKGGGILKREWWLLWDDNIARQCGLQSAASYPPFLFRIAVVDSAFTEKTENDPSACTVWGVWVDPRTRRHRLMLIYAWARHLDFAGLRRDVADTCRKFRVDRLVVEGKASGLSLAQEIRRMYADEPWSVHVVNPGALDKVARAHRASPTLENGVVFAPNRGWADRVIDECAKFPRGKHDDLVDTVTMGINFLRDVGILQLSDERSDEHPIPSGLPASSLPPPAHRQLAASRRLYPS